MGGREGYKRWEGGKDIGDWGSIGNINMIIFYFSSTSFSQKT